MNANAPEPPEPGGGEETTTQTVSRPWMTRRKAILGGMTAAGAYFVGPELYRRVSPSIREFSDDAGDALSSDSDWVNCKYENGFGYHVGTLPLNQVKRLRLGKGSEDVSLAPGFLSSRESLYFSFATQRSDVAFRGIMFEEIGTVPLKNRRMAVATGGGGGTTDFQAAVVTTIGGKTRIRYATGDPESYDTSLGVPLESATEYRISVDYGPEDSVIRRWRLSLAFERDGERWSWTYDTILLTGGIPAEADPRVLVSGEGPLGIGRLSEFPNKPIQRAFSDLVASGEIRETAGSIL